MVSVTRTIAAAASATSRYAPQATIASIAPPIPGPSSAAGTSSAIPSTLAKIFRHSGDFAPPPQILLRTMGIPRLRATARLSRSPNATPSSIACTRSARVVSSDMPTNAARASVPLIGLRSPMR